MGTNRLLANAEDFLSECVRVMYESLIVFVFVLTYRNGTVIWNEKERSSIRVVQRANSKVFLGIK